MDRFAHRALRRTSGSVINPAQFETLERRSLLASAPLPDISSLTSVNNSVVRMSVSFETSSGRVNDDIDIEMFDTQAPITVSNFLKYVRDGDFDKSFFHRFISNFVIQGGLNRLKTATTTGAFESNVETIPTDPAIQNEFSSSRSNVARTLAMAKLGSDPNSATSQWFINLSNNASNLDNQNGGFTVFARVLDDRSWAVVQQMVSVGKFDTNPSDPNNLYNDLPVSTGFTGTNVTEAQMVMISDAEIIKPQGVAEFYRYRYYYPEGFTGSNKSEFLPMGNPGDSTAHYQVIVRSEVRETRPTGNVDFWFRDKVIDHNNIAPRRRAGFTVFQYTDPSSSLIPTQGKAFAYEVWSTQPIATTISHYDAGFSTIESFVGGLRSDTGLDGDQSDTTWAIPDIRKGGNNTDFLIWQNTTAVTANVTIKFIYSNGSGVAPITLSFPTEALRRGGLSIKDISQLPNGKFSAIMTSDQPIVAAITHYNNTPATDPVTPNEERGGYTQVGVAGAGSRVGIIPLGNVNTPTSTSVINDRIAIVNPNNTAAIVTLIFSFEDSTPDFTTTVTLPGNTRSLTSLNAFSALQNKRFSVRYSSGVTPIYASVYHVENGDLAANPLAITAAPIHDFGEGFINSTRNPKDVFEQLALYNPNEATLRGSSVDASVTIKFGYTDGTVVTKTLTVPAGERVELTLDTDTDLIAQNGLGRFFYTINVVSDEPIIAMMRHYDLSLGGLQASGGDSTIGTQRASGSVPVIRLDQLGTL